MPPEPDIYCLALSCYTTVQGAATVQPSLYPSKSPRKGGDAGVKSRQLEIWNFSFSETAPLLAEGGALSERQGAMATEIIPTRHECYEELTRLRQEVARLREVLGWYANEQNYTWSGAPCHWEEKIYHKTAVKIPVPDMGQRAREALKEGQDA